MTTRSLLLVSLVGIGLFVGLSAQEDATWRRVTGVVMAACGLLGALAWRSPEADGLRGFEVITKPDPGEGQEARKD